MNNLVMRYLLAIFAIFYLTACMEEERRGPDPSLKRYLEGIELSCDELLSWDFTKGFLVKKELDGWGVLIISRNNKPKKYDLSLVSHMHERIFETRVVECQKL